MRAAAAMLMRLLMLLITPITIQMRVFAAAMP